MESEQKLRIKSAMIIYALETALGEYVIQNEAFDHFTNEIKNSIVEREKSSGRKISKDDFQLLVESSYLDEIFSLAIKITEGTSINEHIRSLKSFCSSLGIFDIRNAISHPNRPFPDYYWFRAATIASDPLIVSLGLGSVRQALIAAIDENLNSPPEEWFNNVKWSIPNSLPTSFDHEITGLLGRDKEFKDLDSTLSKARNNLIAVVAPGGIGKTALILQFLKDISLSPKWNSKLSAILFCTLKNERLTSEGIEIIEAIDGIDQIKDSILYDLKIIYNDLNIESFDEACEKLEDEKILICIDNLETLLIHSQREFIEFNQGLPLRWRVIVTSRISIDSATTVPLDPLGKRHAVNLARNYFRKRGINDFDQSDLDKIATAANYNPLAIRLTIDLYIKGVDISQSINQSQKDIAAFSYKNLISSLKPNSISILEAIYVLEKSTKSELIELLEFTNEEIAESINELSKTSLIVRKTSESGNDKFALSDSIRDLLLTNPKNIEVRTKISENLKERKNKILEQTTRNQQLGLTEFDEDFVHPETDEGIHVLIADLNKHLSKPFQKREHSELIEIKNRFADMITYNTNNYQLFYHYSRVLRNIKDYSGELKMLLQAEKSQANSPRVMLAKAMNSFYGNDYEKANLIFEKLIGDGFGNLENSSRKFGFTVNKLNLLCLLNLGEYDRIFSRTQDWSGDQQYRVMFGTYRASALKRSIELKKDNLELTEKALSEALEIFNLIFESEDYSVIACVEANKLVREIGSVLYNYKKYSEDFVFKGISFIADHYFGIISGLRDVSLYSNETKTLLKRIFILELENYKNPLHDARWYVTEQESVFDNEHIEELQNDGFTIVTIYHIPDNPYGMSNFMFAKDIHDQEYYLHVDYFETGWNGWGYLKLGDKLAIRFPTTSNRNKPIPANEIVEIDQYVA
jgi:hypothetical protein